MNGKMQKDIPEENVKRLIASSVLEPESDFQCELMASVLQEVRQERARVRNNRIQRTRWATALVAAAALVAVVVLWNGLLDVFQHGGSVSQDPVLPPEAAAVQEAGRVRNVYGLVSLQNGQSPKQVDQAENVLVGQWVETHSGSEAAILLPDESKLSVRPRSRVQIARKTDGAKLVMQRGRLRLEVAKQPPGDSLTIETPGAKITVLGTRLDVHVVQKPDGRKQTRVSVLSGKVELESAGGKIVLLPNMEGIADEGEPPLARSLTAEVNEMIRLVDLTEDLAVNVPTGPPSIVQFNGDGSATIWTVLPVANTTNTDLKSYTLPDGMPALVIEAYTLDGARLPVASAQDGREVDMSLAPVPPGGQAAVIVKLPDIQGAFRDEGSGTHEFVAPANSSGGLSLVQFRLPASAHIEQLSPAPIETRQTLSRLVITVAVDGQLADVFY